MPQSKPAPTIGDELKAKNVILDEYAAAAKDDSNKDRVVKRTAKGSGTSTPKTKPPSNPKNRYGSRKGEKRLPY